MKAVTFPLASNKKQTEYIIFVPMPKTYSDEQLKLDAIQFCNLLAETIPGNLYDEICRKLAEHVK